MFIHHDWPCDKNIFGGRVEYRIPKTHSQTRHSIRAAFATHSLVFHSRFLYFATVTKRNLQGKYSRRHRRRSSDLKHTHTHTQRGNRGQVNDRKQNVRTLRCSSVQAGNFGEVSGLTSPHTSAAFLAAPEGNCARRSYFENNRDADGVSNSRESLREREIARLRFCFLSRLSSRIEH